ncbi:phage tail protein [Alicyclobacillus sp. SO9]|uniref:phage tail protein n=1 Tax=Alicyclobacillus sp. SO9 TaxID=2665646 RepID=UPI0018E7F595|nr:phage tail protein [Alicyclobacillus sp. SO9]QQE80939.1 phage tail protein [Alicyclobacillus sp. SO9]
MGQSEYTQLGSMFLGDSGTPTAPTREPSLYVFSTDNSLANPFLSSAFLPLTIASTSDQYSNIQLQTMLGVSAPNACPYYSAIYTYQLMNASTTQQAQSQKQLVFSVPADVTQAQYLEVGYLVGFYDLDDNFQLFEIVKVDEHHTDTLFKICTCTYLAQTELGDDWISNVTLSNVDAETALSTVLDGTQWQVGTVDVTTIESLDIKRASVSSALPALLAQWGGEMQFRLTVSGSRITGQYVDWLQTVGNNTGKRFVYGKDLKSVQRTPYTTNLKTALRGYGRADSNGNPLTFETVEWSTANGDPVDKPAGQDWVSDPTALAQWGRQNGTKNRFGAFSDSQQTDPATLLQETWDALEQQVTPQITYQMSVVDLERLAGLSFEAVRVGDTVAVIDTAIQPELRLTARVLEIKRDLVKPENTQIVLGNFLPTTIPTQAQLKTLQQTNVGTFDGGISNTTTAASPIPTTQLQGAIKALSNQIQSDGAYVYITNNEGITIYDKPLGQSPTKAMKLGGGIFAIADSKNADGTWAYTTFGTGSGFVADLIRTGTLDASLVTVANLDASQITTGVLSASFIQGGTLTIGGSGNGNGIFALLDNSGAKIVQMNNAGIQLANGATMLGGSGVLSELTFESSGQYWGWSKAGWWSGATNLNEKAYIFAYIPSNFVITAATLTTKAMPTYENDSSASNTWWQLTSGRLTQSQGSTALSGYMDEEGDPHVIMNSMSDITSSAWGSYWSPAATANVIQTKSADVKNYLTPGGRTVFGVDSNASAPSGNTMAALVQFELTVTGYKNG